MDPNKQETNENKARFLKKLRRHLLSAVLFVLLIFAVLLEYLTLTEYRPNLLEEVPVEETGEDPVALGESLRILTWNCGYGAMGDDADFFMDGGSKVITCDRERVLRNLDGIARESVRIDPDLILFQEIDSEAFRSHNINEEITLSNSFLEIGSRNYSSAFAVNYDVRFIPYPIPPLANVQSGLLSFAGTALRSAQRIQLPCLFGWPVRLANYKRCLLVERLPVKDSDHELVIMNLHMDAFADSEGKTEQMDALLQIMEEEAAKGNYVIAGGDFNQSFSCIDNSAYPQQEGKWAPGVFNTDRFSEGWQFVTDSTVPTCRSADQPYENANKETFQYYVIDGFIVSDNIAVRSCKTQDRGFVYTDHNPVVMEFVLGQKPQ